MRILITGHSSLLAQSLATARLTLGDEVTMTSRTALEAFDKKVGIVPFDLSAPDFTQFPAKNFDAVVLNAMTPTPALKAFHKSTLDEEHLTFLRANTEGNMALLQEILPGMVERKSGRIVFISSMIAVHPMSGYSLYGAVKSGMEAIMRSIAFEYGKYNITANSVRPGILATERNRKFREKFEDRMTQNISLKKIATPQQIVEAIHPLLSENCYIQGTEIEVSGGLFIPN